MTAKAPRHRPATSRKPALRLKSLQSVQAKNSCPFAPNSCPVAPDALINDSLRPQGKAMVRVTFHKLQTTKSPPGRCSHSATAVDNGVLILGGGRANDGSSNGQPAFVHFCDAWFLDPRDAQWRELTIESPFTARRGHSALLHERQLVVFGGVADSLSLIHI